MIIGIKGKFVKSLPYTDIEAGSKHRLLQSNEDSQGHLNIGGVIKKNILTGSLQIESPLGIGKDNNRFHLEAIHNRALNLLPLKLNTSVSRNIYLNQNTTLEPELGVGVGITKETLKINANNPDPKLINYVTNNLTSETLSKFGDIMLNAGLTYKRSATKEESLLKLEKVKLDANYLSLNKTIDLNLGAYTNFMDIAKPFAIISFSGEKNLSTNLNLPRNILLTLGASFTLK